MKVLDSDYSILIFFSFLDIVRDSCYLVVELHTLRKRLVNLSSVTIHSVLLKNVTILRGEVPAIRDLHLIISCDLAIEDCISYTEYELRWHGPRLEPEIVVKPFKLSGRLDVHIQK